MARLRTTGFEVQRLSATSPINGEGQTSFTSGAAVIDTTNQRSGAACLACDAAEWHEWNALGGVLGRVYFGRFFFKMAAAPTGVVWLSSFYNGATTQMSVRVTTGRQIGIYNSAGTQIGSLSSALATGEWHRIEFRVQVPVAGNGVLGLRVNGTEVVADTAAAVSNLALINWRVGAQQAPGTTLYFDDVALNDDQGTDQNSWPGDGKVVLLKPVADSARGAGWTTSEVTGNTTDLWQSEDNTPPTGKADTALDVAGTKVQVRNAVSTTTENYDAEVQDYTAAGVGASDVVSLVQAIARVGCSLNTGTSGGLKAVSNPADAAETSIAFVSNAVAAGVEPAGWGTRHGALVYAPTVTKGTKPVVRIGKRTATTRVTLADLMGLLVEYAPSTGTGYTQTSADTIAGTDSSTRSSGKLCADAATGTDAQAKTTGKTQADTVAATDSITPTLTSGGQSRTHSQPDTIQGTDSSARRLTKNIADAIAGTDAVAKAPKKAVADVAAGADVQSRVWAAKLTQADAAAGTDSLVKNPGKVQADPIAGTDAVSRRAGKGLADIGAGTDASSKVVAKNQADVGALDDQAVTGLETLFVVHERTISDGLSVADTRFAAVTKARSEVAGLAEALQRAWDAERVLSEALTFIDSAEAVGRPRDPVPFAPGTILDDREGTIARDRVTALSDSFEGPIERERAGQISRETIGA